MNRIIILIIFITFVTFEVSPREYGWTWKDKSGNIRSAKEYYQLIENKDTWIWIDGNGNERCRDELERLLNEHNEWLKEIKEKSGMTLVEIFEKDQIQHAKFNKEMKNVLLVKGSLPSIIHSLILHNDERRLNLRNAKLLESAKFY